MLSDSRLFAEHIGDVGVFPPDAELLPAEMSVRRKRSIYRLTQFKIIYDSGGTEVDILAANIGDKLIRDNSRAERVDVYAQRLCDADGIRDLYLTTSCKAGGDDIFRNVSRRVARASVHLCRILAGVGAAAVMTVAAVCIDDDLSTGKTRISRGTADDESARGTYPLGTGKAF